MALHIVESGCVQGADSGKKQAIFRLSTVNDFNKLGAIGRIPPSAPFGTNDQPGQIARAVSCKSAASKKRTKISRFAGLWIAFIETHDNCKKTFNYY